jgi:hypothetical protein
MPKKRIGRPALPPKDRRSERLVVRLTEAELQAIYAAAKRDRDIAPSTWVRDAALRALRQRRTS